MGDATDETVVIENNAGAVYAKIGNGGVTANNFYGNATTASAVAWSGITGKPSYYDAKAIKTITRSGTTFTYTCMDGTTGTFTQQDNNTTYTLSSFGITATATELNYCDGVTSNIQTQLNGKAGSSHGTHVSYGTSASALGTSSAGSATTVSRSDHVHALPALTSCSGTLTVAKGGTGSGTKGAASGGALYNLGCIYSATEPSSPVNGTIWLYPA
jgi:hypothetical protein